MTDTPHATCCGHHHPHGPHGKAHDHCGHEHAAAAREPDAMALVSARALSLRRGGRVILEGVDIDDLGSEAVDLLAIDRAVAAGCNAGAQACTACGAVTAAPTVDPPEVVRASSCANASSA